MVNLLFVSHLLCFGFVFADRKHYDRNRCCCKCEVSREQKAFGDFRAINEKYGMKKHNTRKLAGNALEHRIIGYEHGVDNSSSSSDSSSAHISSDSKSSFADSYLDDLSENLNKDFGHGIDKVIKNMAESYCSCVKHLHAVYYRMFLSNIDRAKAVVSEFNPEYPLGDYSGMAETLKEMGVQVHPGFVSCLKHAEKAGHLSVNAACMKAAENGVLFLKVKANNMRPEDTVCFAETSLITSEASSGFYYISFIARTFSEEVFSDLVSVAERNIVGVCTPEVRAYLNKEFDAMKHSVILAANEEAKKVHSDLISCIESGQSALADIRQVEAKRLKELILLETSNIVYRFYGNILPDEEEDSEENKKDDDKQISEVEDVPSDEKKDSEENKKDDGKQISEVEDVPSDEKKDSKINKKGDGKQISGVEDVPSNRRGSSEANKKGDDDPLFQTGGKIPKHVETRLRIEDKKI